MVKNYRPGGVGMFPAAPGTYLVHAYFDDNEADLVRANVIGWQVGAERSLTPLVLDPRAVTDEGWHVLHPDNRVEGSDGRCWEDLEDWLAEERRRRREQLNAHAARPQPTRSELVRPRRGSAPPPAADRTEPPRRSYYEPPEDYALERPTA